MARAILELAILLAVNDLPIGIKHSQSGNPLFHGNLVLLHQVLVLFAPPDIDVYNFIIGGDDRRCVSAMKGRIEYVAVITPVCSEDDNDALVLSRRFLQRLFDFGVRIGGLVVNDFVFCGRLTKTDSAGVKPPRLRE